MIPAVFFLVLCCTLGWQLDPSLAIPTRGLPLKICTSHFDSNFRLKVFFSILFYLDPNKGGLGPPYQSSRSESDQLKFDQLITQIQNEYIACLGTEYSWSKIGQCRLQESEHLQHVSDHYPLPAPPNFKSCSKNIWDPTHRPYIVAEMKQRYENCKGSEKKTQFHQKFQETYCAILYKEELKMLPDLSKNSQYDRKKSADPIQN
jgi:hypothetical protein